MSCQAYALDRDIHFGMVLALNGQLMLQVLTGAKFKEVLDNSFGGSRKGAKGAPMVDPKATPEPPSI